MLNTRETLGLKTTSSRNVDAELQKQREHFLSSRGDDEEETITPNVKRDFKPKKRAPYRPAEGHEIGLATLIKNKTSAEFHFTCEDGPIEAKVVAFDRYTVSLMVDNEPKPRCYYKTNIFYFQEVA